MSSTRGRTSRILNALDSQQVEILGRSRVKAALIEAGLEVATPERDNGIDLIAFRWNGKDHFSAVPIQIKTRAGAATRPIMDCLHLHEMATDKRAAAFDRASGQRRS